MVFPSDELAGFTSDFGGAYKQVPNDPEQVHFFGVTMWNPIDLCVVIGLAATQIFGSRAAPLNFSRFPDWCVHSMAKLFIAWMEQCIDDLICMERLSTAASARSSWLAFAACCGWNIPLKKSPPHATVFRALGVFVDLSPLPLAAASIKACERRLDQICHIIEEVFRAYVLNCGTAASIAGKLLFTTCSFSGRFGRAMLRPFNRRASELHRFHLNPQLAAACSWWIRNLRTAPPRPIPWRVDGRHLVVSYSDGEGSDAGVGIAIWSDKLSTPEAVSIVELFAKAAIVNSPIIIASGAGSTTPKVN
jgi:hypothetical protein